MKTCSKCGKDKPTSDFRKLARSLDGLDGICKSCKKTYEASWYHKSPTRKASLKAYDAKRTMNNRQNLWMYLEIHPCIDCGESDPMVLEFDHRGDKSYNVGDMMTKNNWAKILTEIEKCDVRCANCHRRKTTAQFGFWRATAGDKC